MVDLTRLTTESRNERTMKLDEMTPLEIATVMNEEDLNVIKAVKEELPNIALAISWCSESLKDGGRIIYMGAGTSGRLGVLDSAECPPTFGVSPDVVVGLIAGGEDAFIKAAEGAEDSQTMGEEDLKNIVLSSKDTVVGVAASGRTPYVIYGLRYAKTLGCKTISIACNKGSAMGVEAALAIELDAGPEVLTGSTRLKAGTTQKMVLNMISTGSMVGVGKAYENLMVDMIASNEKLEARARNMVIAATGCQQEEAIEGLKEAKGNVKLAVTRILLGSTTKEAAEALKRADGHVKDALKQFGK